MVEFTVYKKTGGSLIMRSGKLLKIAAVLFVITCFSIQAFAGPLPKPTSKNAEAQKEIDAAWLLYKTDSNAELYKKCVDHMEKANKLDPKNHMLLTDLSRYYWNYGDELPKKTEEQQEKLEGIYNTGLDYAEQSLDVKDTADGHYWLAVNKAASKEFSSIFSQAASFPSIYSHSDKVKALDNDYYFGASGRLWTEVLTRVPKAVVELVNWDVQEAVDDINQSIEKEPGFLDNYLYKARFIYKYFDQKEEALAIMDHILKQDAKTLMPKEETANRTCQKDTRNLWKEITGKDYPNK